MSNPSALVSCVLTASPQLNSHLAAAPQRLIQKSAFCRPALPSLSIIRRTTPQKSILVNQRGIAVAAAQDSPQGVISGIREGIQEKLRSAGESTSEKLSGAGEALQGAAESAEEQREELFDSVKGRGKALLDTAKEQGEEAFGNIKGKGEEAFDSIKGKGEKVVDNAGKRREDSFAKLKGGVNEGYKQGAKARKEVAKEGQGVLEDLSESVKGARENLGERIIGGVENIKDSVRSAQRDADTLTHSPQGKVGAPDWSGVLVPVGLAIVAAAFVLLTSVSHSQALPLDPWSPSGTPSQYEVAGGFFDNPISSARKAASDAKDAAGEVVRGTNGVPGASGVPGANGAGGVNGVAESGTRVVEEADAQGKSVVEGLKEKVGEAVEGVKGDVGDAFDAAKDALGQVSPKVGSKGSVSQVVGEEQVGGVKDSYKAVEGQTKGALEDASKGKFASLPEGESSIVDSTKEKAEGAGAAFSLSAKESADSAKNGAQNFANSVKRNSKEALGRLESKAKEAVEKTPLNLGKQ